jgi:PTH1 family peptidyl-tRNA hydrolase
VKLIVGLGNPGIEYQFTPHNLGFLAIDRIAGSLGVEVRNRQCRALTARAVVGSETVLLAKPETFMNLSGVSVRELVEEYEAKPESDLIVIQDELDFRWARCGFIRGGVRRGTTASSRLSGRWAHRIFCASGLGLHRIARSGMVPSICSRR